MLGVVVVGTTVGPHAIAVIVEVSRMTCVRFLVT
jgi:hypothetical protein